MYSNFFLSLFAVQLHLISSRHWSDWLRRPRKRLSPGSGCKSNSEMVNANQTFLKHNNSLHSKFEDVHSKDFTTQIPGHKDGQTWTKLLAASRSSPKVSTAFQIASKRGFVALWLWNSDRPLSISPGLNKTCALHSQTWQMDTHGGVSNAFQSWSTVHCSARLNSKLGKTSMPRSPSRALFKSICPLNSFRNRCSKSIPKQTRMIQHNNTIQFTALICFNTTVDGDRIWLHKVWGALWYGRNEEDFSGALQRGIRQ